MGAIHECWRIDTDHGINNFRESYAFERFRSLALDFIGSMIRLEGQIELLKQQIAKSEEQSKQQVEMLKAALADEKARSEKLMNKLLQS